MRNAKKILITGGSGVIGSRLTAMLLEKGYAVSHLGRSRKNNTVKTFVWDPPNNLIEEGALEDVDVVVHLAGAGIADKQWNEKRKKEIWDSRINTGRLIRETLAKQRHDVGAFISASGINFYGLEDTGHVFVESDPPGDDFMARVTAAWEKEADAFSAMALRVVKIRTGVALSRRSVALIRIARPVRFLVGAALGTGRQYFNWIHIDDLCGIYLKAIEDEAMQGAYNGVAPNPITNKEFTQAIAKVLKKPLWLPPVPGFIIKLIAGDVAEVVLNGGKVSGDKVQDAGFKFQFCDIADALKDIYSHRGV